MIMCAQTACSDHMSLQMRVSRRLQPHTHLLSTAVAMLGILEGVETLSPIAWSEQLQQGN